MRTLFASLAACLLLVAAAPASTINVFPGDPNWSNTPGSNSGGGSSFITATSLLDGDGAVAINGDRTRFGITNANYGSLSSLSSFGFQWAVTQTGAGVVTAQAPALRLFVADPIARPSSPMGRSIQFIWEDGEQSAPVFVNGAGSRNTTYTGDFFNGRVYAFTSGFGRGLFDNAGNLIAGSDSAQSLNSLIGTLNSPNAFVFSYGVGVGSSVGSGFSGFADRITIGFGDGDPTTYNFLVAAEPVPEPATLAVFGGLVLAGGLVARRRMKKAA